MLHRWLRSALNDPALGWSLGAFGAIAEFIRAPGEAAVLDIDRLSAATARGAIRLHDQAATRALAYETPGRQPGHWNHALVLCLPAAAAAMSGRAVLTELGPDRAAVRSEDREAILFDLGLDLPQTDACIRTGDPATLARLRAALGRSIFEPGNDLMAAMPALSPHRVFIGALGRIEVFQPIPAPGGASPAGPHTHVLPKLLGHRRSHAATVPVPDGLLPVVHLHPANPWRDAEGQPKDFSVVDHERFQPLLQAFGDPAALAVKSAVWARLAAGEAPLAEPESRELRAAIRVALRQWQALRGPVPGPWLARFETAASPNA